MDTDLNDPEVLSDLEKRLAAWKPASVGLDAEHMLYAAGRAAPRSLRGRVVIGGLGLLVIALASWAMIERTERLALAEQLRQAQSIPQAVPPTIGAPSTAEPSNGEEEPAGRVLVENRLLDEETEPNTVLSSHRLIAKGLDALLQSP